MKRVLIVIALVFIVSGCAKSMRYSYEEIKSYPPEMQSYIKNSEIAIGMTFQQVRYAWGPPALIKVLDPTPDGKDRVQWEYPRMLGAVKSILRFTSGKLTEIISTEPGVAK